MITANQARRIALAQPEAEERAHMGHPDFRVRNRIFMTLWPDGKHAVIKLAPADQTALIASDPEAFALNSWSRTGYTTVNLPRVGVARFRAVVESSWRLVAPKSLQKQVG